jgi:hypothetical protein
MSPGSPLHSVKPREQVGPQTGSQYEYQYHQAAAGALSLIDGTDTECIYCEWHDDYVTESAGGSLYTFSQVKTRARSRGPWTFSEFFGLGRKRKDQPALVTTTDTIFAHMWDHTRKFGARCGRFVFVSDADVDASLSRLLLETKAAQVPAEMPAELFASFSDLQKALEKKFPDATIDSLFKFLSSLYVQEGTGTLRDLAGCRVLIANRILEVSEIDLLISEAKKIGADLVSAVRQRSHLVLPTLPQTAEELRAKKGLVIENVLRLLSLSTEGYVQLRSGSRESVVTLSRLDRLCRKNKVPDDLIPDLCRLKTEWTSWWIMERDRIDQTDYLALKAETADLLRVHSVGDMDFTTMVDQAKGIAEKHRVRLTSSSPLTKDLVVGMLIDLAVEVDS